MAFCLMGFIGLVSLLFALKRGVDNVPRILYQLFLLLTCAPFFVALVRPPKLPFLIAPVVAISLLYPVATPHNIVWGTDPIFNLAFTADVVGSGFWTPGVGRAFAETYSLYPIGNVFIGYLILTSGVAPEATFHWIEPVLRLLAVPLAVYAIGRRMFGIRVGTFGLFLYLGTASILFNAPVQQGIGIIFVSLSLLALFILTQSPDRTSQRRAQVLFAIVAGAIIMTHHMSSYIFAAWLVALAVLLLWPRLRPDVPLLRVGIMFLYFIVLLGLYILTVSSSVFDVHQQTLDEALARVISPESASGGPSAGLGRTFSQIEVAWLAGSVLGLLVLAVLSIRLYRRADRNSFACANGYVAAVLVLVTLPLIATSLNFVPLRVSEYENLIIAPFAAVTLTRWFRRGQVRVSRIPFRNVLEKGRRRPLAVVVVAALLFMGGNLAPISWRMYFEAPELRNTESPLHIGQSALRAAGWARTHYEGVGGRPALMWGDQMSTNVFSGFGGMEVMFGNNPVFTSDTVNESVWIRLQPGDYVVVNHWMYILKANFYLEPPLDARLPATHLDKFAKDPNFALVYQDEEFSVYYVMSDPYE